MKQSALLSIEAALDVIGSSIRPGPQETVALGEALNRVLAAEVRAPSSVPPFDNSAMDGYAVRTEALDDASESTPVGLPVSGVSAAGEQVAELASGACQRVFTGAPLPRGADGVVMQEDVTVDEEGIAWFREPLRPWRHVRFAGEDIEQGARVSGVGDRVGPLELGVFSAVGLPSVPVRRRPKVAVIATGSELKEPGVPLTGGAIYESNRVMLTSWLTALGAIPHPMPLVSDDPSELTRVLREAQEEMDFILVTGGASVGDHDHSRDALEEAGGRTLFHRVAIKPGKPILFGALGSSAYFGLPGNPVSAMVTFQVFVIPAIRLWLGESTRGEETMRCDAGEDFSLKGDRVVFLRVTVDENGRALSAGPQGSHQLNAAMNADGLLRLDPGVAIAKGAPIRVIPTRVWGC